MDNKKKTKYNVIFGFSSQVIIIALGLIIPRIVLKNYDSDTNGLTSTVTQVFTYMALLEAGIGQATRNALYSPLSKNDKDGISYIMSISRRYYRKITLFYAIGVVVLSALLPFLIKSRISYWTIFFVVFFEGLTQVISFWFTQNWIQLLTAAGDYYIRANAELVGRVGGYGVKIVLATFGVNIAFIQLGYFLISLVKLIYYKWYMTKHFSWINYDIAPKEAKLPHRNAYIVSEIAWTVFSSTDLIILSMFCSTELASVYAIYNMVFSNVNSVLNSIYQGTHYMLGRAYHENSNKYIKMHDAFNSTFIGAMTMLMSVSYILILPFVKLYTAGVADVEYVYELLPLAFCLIQLLSWSRYVGGNLMMIAGYAKLAGKVSVVEAAVNLIGSLLLVNKFGIVGVAFATVIALPIKVVCVTWISEKKILHRSCLKTLAIYCTNAAIFIGAIVFERIYDLQIVDFYGFIKWGIILCIAFSLIVVALNCIVNPSILKLIKRYKGN